MYCFCYFFFFNQKTAYYMRISDWSSDVCSSDLIDDRAAAARLHVREGRPHRPPGAPGADLQRALEHLVGLVLQQDIGGELRGVVDQYVQAAKFADGALDHRFDLFLEIGRASCRERVCQYV